MYPHIYIYKHIHIYVHIYIYTHIIMYLFVYMYIGHWPASMSLWNRVSGWGEWGEDGGGLQIWQYHQ